MITAYTEKEQQKISVADKNTGKTHPDKSIAVLPFADMSSTHDQEYLGDGLAEEILNSLVHLKDLKVAGRTLSFQFKFKGSYYSKISASAADTPKQVGIIKLDQ